MKTNAALLIASLAATGLAMPPAESYVVHEKRSIEQPHIAKRAAANGNENLAVRIALKQNNIEKAEERLLDISNPQSRNYGKHLSHKEVVDLFAANDDSIAAVKAWLVKSGIPESSISIDKTKTWFTVKTNVGKLEKILKARYNIYENRASGIDLLGTDVYSLPADISDVVDYILPGPSMTKRADKPTQHQTQPIKEALRPLDKATADRLKANGTKAEGLDNCDKVITPECIKAMYKIPEPTGSNVTNPMGIFESLDDVYAQEDLDLFFKIAAPNIPAGTGPNLDLINGATAPNDPSEAGGESNLDFDMAYPIIYPQQTTLFQVKGGGNDDVFGDFLAAIDKEYCNEDPTHKPGYNCGNFEPTNVVSISYGGDEDPSDLAGIKRRCTEFMKLGLIGVTTVASSGDSGVASRGNYCWGSHHDVFVPQDPAACPYITAVGATTLPAGRKVGQAETATTSFSSGGGFSNIYLTPDWQKDAVGKYLLRHNPNYFAYNTSNGVVPPASGKYNRGGRGYPDIAALGDNGLVVSGQDVHLSGGTSMSAPIIAAIFTRINEQRLNLGKGPIGFANPALYKAYATQKNFYNDITEGNQALGGAASDRGPSACGNNGFSCVQGWDPVTGLGTPNYPAWEKYFVNL